MDVWEETEHPWLKAEKQAIRDWVQAGKPYMGLCLGHQLLGSALGGKVGKMPKAEVGILDITLTEAGRADPLFAGIGNPFQALQWHGAAVLEAPEGAVILGESPVCANQAMRVGALAYGLQCHTRIDHAHGRRMGRGAGLCLRRSMRRWAQGALARLDAEAGDKMADFARDSRRLYDNFMNLLKARG